MYKKNHGGYLTIRAYNGRVVTQWLSDCLDRYMRKEARDEPGTFGVWLASEGNWPHDVRLELTTFAMQLGN